MEAVLDEPSETKFAARLHACYGLVQSRCYLLVRFDPNAKEAAEDLAQETMARAWRSRHMFRDEAELSSWMYRIATNAYIDQRRRTKKRRSVRHVDIDSLNPADQEKIKQTQDYVDPVLSSELASHVAFLPKRLREVSDLYLMGHPLKEISSILNVKEGTVKSRLNRSQHRLRELICKA